MIEHCGFGSMTIGQTTYTTDLMIYPDGKVDDAWRRAVGHRLEMADIHDLLASDPEVIVAGTGIYGLMRINKEVMRILAGQGVELVSERTRSAARTFNQLKQTDRRVAACFHLTC